MQRNLLTILFLLVCHVLFGQQTTLNLTTTAVPFLRINPDAKAAAMGDNGLATTPDIYSMYYNSAKLPFNKSRGGIGVSYTPWLTRLGLKNVYLLGLTGYYKISEEQSVQMSVRYFSLGNITFSDYFGNVLGSSNPNEFSVDAGYSRKLSRRFGLGVNLRFIYSNLVQGSNPSNSIAYKAGVAVSGDINLYHNLTNEIGQGFSWGLSLSNLGSKIGYTSSANSKDFIPANLGWGGTYNFIFDEFSKFQYSIEINKLLVPLPPISVDNGGQIDSAAAANYRSQNVITSWVKSFSAPSVGTFFKNFVYSTGGEYSYKYRYDGSFAVRVGFLYDGIGLRQYFTTGVGFSYKYLGLNFAYLLPTGGILNQNPLLNTIRLGLFFNLDKRSFQEENSYGTY
ncbi:MAG: type IX secretion system outer membrane channel protein PorV [Phycisphaerales bacterium]|nr:type IX secretion system outer membrane channel protein PorV [Phycisphaerales bacterium]